MKAYEKYISELQNKLSSNLYSMESGTYRFGWEGINDCLNLLVNQYALATQGYGLNIPSTGYDFIVDTAIQRIKEARSSEGSHEHKDGWVNGSGGKSAEAITGAIAKYMESYLSGYNPIIPEL